MSLVCIACTPLFERELRKAPGVISVKPLAMLNTINVEINPQITTTAKVHAEILKIAARAGMKNKIVFRPS
jgi:copper chaperone CopZ